MIVLVVTAFRDIGLFNNYSVCCDILITLMVMHGLMVKLRIDVIVSGLSLHIARKHTRPMKSSARNTS